MKEEKFYFQINDVQLPLPITMEEAIGRCRDNAINHQTCQLFVKNKRGTWTYLGTYKPDPESPVPYTFTLPDNTKRTIPVEVCIAEPAVPKYKH